MSYSIAIILGTCWKPKTIFRSIRTYSKLNLLYSTLPWMTLYLLVLQPQRPSLVFWLWFWLLLCALHWWIYGENVSSFTTNTWSQWTRMEILICYLVGVKYYSHIWFLHTTGLLSRYQGPQEKQARKGFRPPSAM